jgi:predicted nucleotidyltransferase
MITNAGNMHTAIVEKIKSLIPGVKEIYIFGSQVSGETHPDSDVDLAFRSDTETDAATVWDIAQELAEILNRDVDLIDLNKVGDILKMEIIYHGKCLYSFNEDDRLFFESRVVQKYLDLKELIKPIEDSIKISGSIYT